MQCFLRIGDRFQPLRPKNLNLADDLFCYFHSLLDEIISETFDADGVADQRVPSSLCVAGFVPVYLDPAALRKNCLRQIREKNDSAYGWLVVLNEFLLPQPGLGF